MSSPNLKAACLSVGLVSAWAATADAEIITEVRYETNFLAEVTHARLMLGGPGSGSLHFFDVLSIPGSGSGFFGSTLDAPSFGDRSAMIGLYGLGSGAYGVMVTTPGLTLIWDLAFEEVFPGWSEAALVNSLLTDRVLADGFLQSEFSFLGVRHEFQAVCAAFSEASPFGSMTVEVVTVPAPAAAAILPIFYLAHRRRRR